MKNDCFEVMQTELSRVTRQLKDTRFIVRVYHAMLHRALPRLDHEEVKQLLGELDLDDLLVREARRLEELPEWSPAIGDEHASIARRILKVALER